jgi:hypothetical protein
LSYGLACEVNRAGTEQGGDISGRASMDHEQVGIMAGTDPCAVLFGDPAPTKLAVIAFTVAQGFLGLFRAPTMSGTP